MKKLLVAFVAIVAVSFASCVNTNTQQLADSLDSLANELEAAADSLEAAADTLALDTIAE